MIILNDSFNGNTTYIVGHYFKNGCQIQPLNKIKQICKLFNVEQHYIDELNDALENPINVWGDNEDWESVINHEDFNVKVIAVKQGKCINKLINDKSWLVRVEVAKQGYGLYKLIDDEDWFVRAEVAKKGYGLDKLIDDDSWNVRIEVARQGYGLDVLINDEYWMVREVARQKHILNK